MAIITRNPSTGERIHTYEEMAPEEVRRHLDMAVEAQRAWRATDLKHRAGLLRHLAGHLRERAPTCGELMTIEMGKPLAEAKAEVEKCAWVCDFYADTGPELLADQPVETDASRSYVAFQPLGIVLAIMPWNFPFWQVIRFAAPTLMAGNAVVLKHAPNVSGCAVAIENLMLDAGFPAGLFRTLLIDVPAVAQVIEHPGVRAVTLTGSTRAGKAVASQAAALVKKTVLELGGSDPSLILEDANLEAAATSCATSRMINSGQSCVAAKRFVVVEEVRERFEALLVERMAAARMGDPMDPDTTLGPLAREDLQHNLARQVEESTAAGALCLLGGERPGGPGYFYPPTVLSDVRPGMPAYEEELFGPVASIIPVADEAEAIRVANDTAYGLGASVYTQDTARGERIAAHDLEAGCCFVNGLVKSDPRLPFGGVKESGYGRELAAYGLREFVNVKTVWVA